MKFIEVDGLRIAYERVGEGPPLVFLHGYVGDGPTNWRRQIEGLSDEFTVVAWDALGAGRSSDPSESLGMSGSTSRGPEKPDSGVCVRRLGRLSPRQVAERRLQQALVLAEMSPEAFADTLLPTMFSEATPAESVDEFEASVLAFHPAGFRAMARASAEDLRDVLPDVRVPTLLVYGDKDARAPLTVANNLHAAIRDSTLVVLRGAGHVCNVEAPEEFNRAVRSFLRTVAP